MWEPQLAALSAHEVVRVDHPGHGDEPVAALQTVAELTRHVLARIAAPRFSFVGLSLGGAVGMQLGLAAPERLERLVLCGTAARFGPPEQWRERASLVRSEGLEAIVDAVLERWFTPGFLDVQRFREMFLSTDAEGYARCCEALARWDAGDELRGIAAPTLCIAGEDDPSTPPDELRRLAETIPHARATVVADARHLATVERADEVNPLLTEFLA
jgi:3-oxoadipate enol-lactonase